jgi:hypothetical protein
MVGFLTVTRRIPKPIKRTLRQLAELAYELELGRELAALRSEFDRWQTGEITAFDLSAAVHRFHQGAARDLYVAYTSSQPQVFVATAIQKGILDSTQIAADVLKELAGSHARAAKDDLVN